MDPIRITRSKMYNRGGRFAWSYYFTVIYPKLIPSVGQLTANFDRFSAALSAAKRNAEPGQAIVTEWKEDSSHTGFDNHSQ